MIREFSERGPLAPRNAAGPCPDERKMNVFPMPLSIAWRRPAFKGRNYTDSGKIVKGFFCPDNRALLGTIISGKSDGMFRRIPFF